MTLRYVDAVNGSDSNDGLTPGNAYLTLNKPEDVPVVAGDTVHIASGTYPETLTCDVSGTSGNPITYVGDWTGEIFGNAGGVVRITGSNDDISPTRGNCVVIGSNSFRTFKGFTMDFVTNDHISLNSDSAQSDIILEDLFIQGGGERFYRRGG